MSTIPVRKSTYRISSPLSRLLIAILGYPRYSALHWWLHPIHHARYHALDATDDILHDDHDEALRLYRQTYHAILLCGPRLPKLVLHLVDLWMWCRCNHRAQMDLYLEQAERLRVDDLQDTEWQQKAACGVETPYCPVCHGRLFYAIGHGSWGCPSHQAPWHQEKEKAQPQYDHDCSLCTFLGRYDHDGTSYDLYHCMQQTSTMPTLLARYSSNGPDYHSGLEFGEIHAHARPIQHFKADGTFETRPADPASPLGEAYRRARARGLSLTYGVQR